MPRPPPEIAEEVELFAREWGRTAKLHFVPHGGWFARFELKPNDPRMKAVRDGTAPEVPTEDVWFHLPHPRAGEVVNGVKQGPFIPIPLGDLGPSGVRRFLERGNTWSGRGEFASFEEAVKFMNDKNEQVRATNKKEAKEHARDHEKDTRRTRWKTPFLPVGIDLKSK
jgi:hypothetical protein